MFAETVGPLTPVPRDNSRVVRRVPEQERATPNLALIVLTEVLLVPINVTLVSKRLGPPVLVWELAIHKPVLPVTMVG